MFKLTASVLAITLTTTAAHSSCPVTASIERTYPTVPKTQDRMLVAEGDRMSPSGGDRSPCNSCGTGVAAPTSAEKKSDSATSGPDLGDPTNGGDPTAAHAPRDSYSGPIADATTDKRGTSGGSDGGDPHSGHDSGDGAAR